MDGCLSLSIIQGGNFGINLKIQNDIGKIGVFLSEFWRYFLLGA
jgi:hypothetical protein